MRLILSGVALVSLAACGTSIPESGPDTGAGVGFGNYQSYQAEKAARDVALAGNALPPPDAVSSESLPIDGTPSASRSADGYGSDNSVSSIAADTRAVLDATDERDIAANSGEPVIHASPDNPAPEPVNTAGISDENDFEAVDSRRTIESDAARIARNRQEYQVAAVESLPSRTGGSGPNIVEYALSTKHPMGTQVYRRAGIGKEARYVRNCAKYTSPDMAQIEFLDKGGPERDRLGLDPDGDGYACRWDPRPFRKAVDG